jgi:hypothetical protein
VSARSNASSRLRIVVLGYVVRGPIGGMVWSDLHYVLGLRRLGHDVWFLEDSDDYPSCVDPVRKTIGTDPTRGLGLASALFERAGFGDRWAYHDAHTATWHGPAGGQIRTNAARADVLLNLAGVNPIRPWLEEIPHRVLIDKDPVFTQLRNATDPAAAERSGLHTCFFTFGENIGRAAARIPPDGLDWQPTRHPIWLSGWPAIPPPRVGHFTTIMQWESYPVREHEGVRYGVKADSFAEYLDLPRRVEPVLELVLGGSAVPRDLLGAHGWRIVDPLAAVPDLWAYRRYVQGSRAELTVAKQAYVVSRSGWFSERSASYLASGRPVVTEETGFSDWLPTGDGVVSFSNREEAAAAIEDVQSRYASHREAARDLARSYFDSKTVLTNLLERVLVPATAPPRAGAA